MELSEETHDLSESLVWAYLVDLLLAVQHLHDHDLIHMDIKPENIFIGMDGICKLGDFGLVIDLTKMDLSHAVEGDPRYLANEVLQDRKYTKATDIFALGVTILELATDLDLPKHGT
jgi:membrane-associated tyrosine/threonine-specific cdc2-inhibitory kinase